MGPRPFWCHLVQAKIRRRLISTEATVVGCSHTVRVGISRSRVLSLLIHCCAAIIVGEKLFHFPVVLLNTNRELKIFFGDGIPVLQMLLVQQIRDDICLKNIPYRPS